MRLVNTRAGAGLGALLQMARFSSRWISCEMPVIGHLSGNLDDRFCVTYDSCPKSERIPNYQTARRNAP